MKTSQVGIDLIKSFESLQLKAYKAVPTEKYYTIGYGHYSPNITPGQTISKETAENLLKLDLQEFEEKLNKLGLQLTQNQFDALISFIFNVGFKNFLDSTLLKRIRMHASCEEIKYQFKRWNRSGGKILNGLTKRRQKEADLFCS